uniref:Proteasome 26S subunit, non-ATPase 4 n=1 Tax=Cyanoderma ruficeps TaxID=181631 RepID=A0A8C3QYC3_9PASS
MVLESTMVCNCEVLTTLTPDTGRILSKLHTVQPKGKITFGTGIRVAHLALKHRQGKNHKMRIIAFVGSPVHDSDKDVSERGPRSGSWLGSALGSARDRLWDQPGIGSGITGWGPGSSRDQVQDNGIRSGIGFGESGIGSGISLGSTPRKSRTGSQEMWDQPRIGWVPGMDPWDGSLGSGAAQSQILVGCGHWAGSQIPDPADPGEFPDFPAGEVGQAPEEGEGQRGHHQLRGGGGQHGEADGVHHGAQRQGRQRLPPGDRAPREGGAMLGLGASDFEFGVDPSADPELALVGSPKSQKIPCFHHQNPVKY